MTAQVDTLDDLFFSDLDGAAYLETEARILDKAAGQEWREIASREGYYTQPSEFTEEETEQNVNQFTYFD